MFQKMSQERKIAWIGISVILFLVVIPGIYTSSAILLREVIKDGNNIWLGLTKNNADILGRNPEIFITRFSILIPLLAVIYLSKETLGQYGFIRFKPLEILQGNLKILLYFTLFTLLFGILIGVLTLFFKMPDSIKSLGSLTGAGKIHPGIISLVISYIALTFNSIVEELCFRSYFYIKLKEILKNEWVCIFIISLLFGLCHTYQGVYGFIVIFLLALALSINFRKYRNIYTLIVFHTIKNSIALLFWLK
jgi:membrane protease YdiL (CAAX protease family)